MLDEVQIKIKNYLLEGDKDKLFEYLNHMHAIDISLILDEFENDEFYRFYELVDTRLMAEIMEQARSQLQTKIIRLLDFKSIVQLLSYMSKDDITDILGHLPIKMRKDLLNLMKEDDSKQLQVLLGYEEDSAGGIMTTEYIALNGERTILESLKKIKEIGPKTEVIETIYVLNNKKELIGTVDLRNILIAPEDTTLYSIMDDNIIAVEPEIDQEEVALLVSKYDLKSIPVVNRNHSLLGVITVDDIIDVIVAEQTEDMLRLGGVSKEERVDSSLLTSISKRLPWLFINLGTAFLASFTVGLFEDVISQVVALAAAMPIVAGMGGNAGSQTLSLVIRSIALGEVELKKNWKLVFKEISLGVVHGATIGLFTGIILFMRYGNPYLGMIIFAAMIGNLVIAGFFGFLIPLILKGFKIDPALASSIFLTTATDVFGFFLFLGLAKMFLPLLV
jgi:magnesium transporter